MVGRPREFDEDEVLDKAVDLFWSRGYEATSMADLVEHMGISRQSLYNAFGDKHGLFLAALGRYERTRTSILERLLDEGDGLTAIEAYLNQVVTGSCATRRGSRRACLLTNTLVERAPHDEEIASAVAGFMNRLTRALTSALERARAAGELRDDADIPVLAEFLTTTVQGMLVVGKAGASRESLRKTADVALEVLR